MVFLWNLSDSRSPQISRTLLSILADHNNAVVSMVSTHPVISKSPRPCINPLVSVLRALITIGITVTFMFHRFFQLPSKVLVLFLLFPFVQFHFVVYQDSKVLFFLFLFFIFLSFFFFFFFFFFGWVLLSLVVSLRLGDPFICQNPRGVCASHFLGQILDCAYTICSCGQTSISCTFPSWSPFQPSRV